MSRWREFGFPDLAGTPVQTALEGLYLAAMERHQVMGRGDLVYQKYFCSASPVYYTVRLVHDEVHSLLGNNNHYWHLPNGEVATSKRMAEFIGEELIDIPRYGYQSVLLNTPWKYDLYTWAIQCYRILNALYLVKDNRVDGYGFHQHLEGYGENFSEAASNGDTESSEGIYGNDFWIATSCHASKDSCSIIRNLAIPLSVPYPWHMPGDLYIVSNASRLNWDDPEQEKWIDADNVSRSERFDSFGTAIPFKERKVLTHIPIPEDTEAGTQIPTGLREKFDMDVKDILPDVPAVGDSSTRNELYANLEYWTDFHNGFKFYDSLQPQS